MERERLERERFLNQVSTLRQQGLTVRAIAAELEIHPSRVQRALKALQQPAGNDTTPEHRMPPSSGVLARYHFIGRQREMGILKAAWEDAQSGRGRLVMLAGEPGIGKTRICQELAACAVPKGARVLWGRCYEEPAAPPYWPWVQVIRSYVQQRTTQIVRSEMGAGAADISEVVPELQELLPDTKPPPVLGPEQARFRLFDSIASFLKTASRNRPLLLLLDNLHWADKPSLLLLEFLAKELEEARLLVVGTYRDTDLSRIHHLFETLGELTRERAFQRLLLRGLSQEEVGRFIETTTGALPPPGLVELVHTQTEGNPLYMTEVVRLLGEEGHLTPEGVQRQSWSFRIPEGVREVIGRRLNRLSQHCNQALTVASVIGREFSLEPLEKLIEDMSGDQLLEVLEEALSAHMLEEVPGSVGRYRFSHALVRDTIASELSTTRRMRLHGRIAQVLEKLCGAQAEAHANELAYHFSEAQALLGHEKLVRYSLLAGERALTIYAWEEALRHFQRGLEAKEGHPSWTDSRPGLDAETAALLFGLGRAQAATLERHQLGEAVDSLSQALGYYAEVGDVVRAVAIVESAPTSRPASGLGWLSL